ncbi:Fc receptor-like protein 5 isoform X2 [Hyla sarda]|uniref:Fc receptor-like protein 5 isoform X2 n=1 Tax=Hyla sarda TaxID=327740 RepID=UPI0024C3C3CF|nr:Fc receptor-like protein 5 isoform X2 [Hyla sarda]
MPILLFTAVTWLLMDCSGAVRPVVTLTLNWENVLLGDSVTLTCDIGSAVLENQTYYWYKGKEQMENNQKNIKIRSASWTDLGSYKCHSSLSDICHPINLYIREAPLILQKPPSIYEGKSLTLRCHSPPRYNVLNTTFYKEDIEIQSSANNSELYIKKATRDVTGKYRCSKVRQIGNGYQRIHAESYIHVTNNQGKPIYYWYKDEKPINKKQQNFTIKSASWKEAGDYKCYTSESDISYPVKLNVNYAPLILQRPQDILEGDFLTLRCHSRSEYRVRNTTFYKDDIEVKSSVSDSSLLIDKLDGTVTGKYKCAKVIEDHDKKVYTLSDDSLISVSELISHPQIQAPSGRITEDDDLTLTCDTRLNPLRDHTELRFAFYRNGQEVQGFGSSDTYRIQFARREDSGNYTCQVMTPTLTKTGNVSYILVEELFSYPEIKVPPLRILGHGLALTCFTRLNPLRPDSELMFTFYKDGWKVQENRSTDTYIIQSTQLEDSGNYTCEVWRVSGPMRKTSDISYVQIQDYTHQNIMRLVLSGLTLMAAAGLIFYHKKPIGGVRGRPPRNR